MINWLQRSLVASVLLLVVRLYLGFGWFTLGLGKVTGEGFNATGFLRAVIENPVKTFEGGVQYPLKVSFLKNVVIPMAPVVNVLTLSNIKKVLCDSNTWI